MGNGNKSLAVLGASRGFGRSFCRRMWEDSEDRRVFLVARKAELLSELKQHLLELKQGTGQKNDLVEFFSCDFSREEGQIQAFHQLEIFRPERVFYFAGGGPYGAFEKKAWKDHWWSFQVTFLFAARVVHWAMEHGVQQVVLIGSAISESAGDPRGASYSAAKHGLLGLYRSIHLENPSFDLRLFSPGYMDTDLLPLHAPPRQSELVRSPEEVVEILWKWSNLDTLDRHLVSE
ncbi:MAG: SDR family NAD(P)-dependent oxidoreductase [Bdellovibrionales bacterium]|nr:SDR family NAD(P)-dependent oxidoreductase [Bdellovibrionales bacterium]